MEHHIYAQTRFGNSSDTLCELLDDIIAKVGLISERRSRCVTAPEKSLYQGLVRSYGIVIQGYLAKYIPVCSS